MFKWYFSYCQADKDQIHFLLPSLPYFCSHSSVDLQGSGFRWPEPRRPCPLDFGLRNASSVLCWIWWWSLRSPLLFGSEQQLFTREEGINKNTHCVLGLMYRLSIIMCLRETGTQTETLRPICCNLMKWQEMDMDTYCRKDSETESAQPLVSYIHVTCFVNVSQATKAF